MTRRCTLLLQAARAKTSLVSHYNRHQRSQYLAPGPAHTGDSGAVLLVSRSAPPDNIGPATVDEYQGATDGVWHPDGLAPSLSWRGAAAVPADAVEAQGFPLPFNPFAGGMQQALVDAYTERLQQHAQEGGDAHPLQGFLPCRSFGAVDKDRGNLAIANQGAPSLPCMCLARGRHPTHALGALVLHSA